MNPFSAHVVSLRTLLMSLVAILAAVALVLAGGDLKQSLSSYRHARLLAEQNRLADHCLQAAKSFALERGRSNVVLQGASPIGTDNRRLIDERRQSTDLHLTQVLAFVPENVRREGIALATAWDAVKRSRPILDDHLARPLAERDQMLGGRWLQEADLLMGALDRFLSAISVTFAEVDARFENMNTLRHLVLQFRDVIGRESAGLAAELSAGRVPTPQLLATLRILRGRSIQLWAQIEAHVARMSDPDTGAALSHLQAVLFDRLRGFQDQMIEAADRNGRAPITLSSYLSASILALDASIELADSVNRAASRYADERVDKAKRQALLSLVSIAAILLLAGLTVMLMLRRFTRPLNEILARIDRLIARHDGEAKTRFSDSDSGEFERVGEALILLEETMEAHLRAEAALNASQRINASILACAPQAVVVTSGEGIISVFSPGAQRMLGYAPEEIVGTSTPMRFHDHAEVSLRAKELSIELGVEVPSDFNALVARMRSDGRPDEREWTFIRKDGTRLRVLLTLTTLRDERGEMSGYLGVASDVTERSRIAAEMSRLAYFDHLTHLPNRRLLHDRLQVALNQARREQSGLAVLLIDLDKFKPVNDEYGHAVGDALLLAVADRMQNCLRDSDTLARIGGDEFLALLVGVASGQDAIRVADKIRGALAQPFDLGDGIVAEISCSVGIALYPEHGLSEKTLMKRADDAMYAAKDSGRDRVCLSAPGMDEHDPTRGGQAIVRLIWHRSYRCGDAAIDYEHQTLFRLANAVIDALLDAESRETLLPSLDELIAFVAEHFAHEERILLGRHYEGLEAHTAEHRRLLDRARALRREAESGHLSLGDLVSFVSMDMVAEHMLREDRKYYALFSKVEAPAGATAVRE